MVCPFCHNQLSSRYSSDHIFSFCDEEDCLIGGDMPRYGSTYNINSELVSETYYLEPYYVQVNCAKNITLVSVLDVIILIDTVILHKSITLNFDDPKLTLNKIKTLMVFS